MKDCERERDFESIMSKIKELNPNAKINSKISKIQKELKIIFDIYNIIDKNGGNIDDKTKIKNLYNNKENENENEIDYFLIAKMIFYNKKHFNFIPRKIQIISLIFFLEKDKKNGLVQQINTGEGKSCIISFLAVYIALKENKKIDILTSSPILAKRDSIAFKDFYSSFNLTTGYSSDHNEDARKNNQIFTQDSYDCYKEDIVYGDALSFEGDILRTNFMGILGRGTKRKFDCIIIDEIDNIALDNLKNTTELLDSFHGYKFLEYIYLFIYKKLKEMTDNKRENINEKKDEIIQELKEECTKEFNDLEKLKEEKFVFIPNHLKKYIQDRLDDWCESAYLAKFVYSNNENYIKRSDKEYNINVINPIDFYNTGVTQENSVWAGLHQFLQISESQMITEENLSSCYMSNLSFFNKYIKINENNEIIENNIYGLTGTIGSEYNIKTLKALYNLEPLIIPPFRESKLIIEEPNILLIKNDEKDLNNQHLKKKNQNQNQISYKEKWIMNIKNKIFEMIGKGRAVLVIFQYIKEAKRMKNICNNSKNSFNKIIYYSRSDLEEDKFLECPIEPKTVILSTNLSGRGTDIRISNNLKENGGLHVILAYEPFNLRIERQAFGRAGRKGENGSAGKIIFSCMTQEEAINEMNKREEEESNFLINVYKEKIYAFERMFDKFSKFISEINERTHDEKLLLDLKERWGLFLIENSMNNIEKKYKKNKSIEPNIFHEIENNYEIFEKQLSDYYYEFDLTINKFKNIYRKAKNIAKSCDKKKYEFLNGLYLNKYDNLDKINEGINLCPELCLGGYMFKIIENIKIINSNFDEENINKIYDETINTFETLIKCINLLIKQFNTYKIMIGYLGYNKPDREIFQQNEQKLKLMNKILLLMSENKEVFIKYKEKKSKSKFLKVIQFSLRKLVAKEELKINKLVIEYFRDYGVCLFKLEDIKKDDCLIY